MLAIVKTLLNWIRNVYWAVTSYRQFGRDVIMMSSRQKFIEKKKKKKRIQ